MPAQKRPHPGEVTMTSENSPSPSSPPPAEQIEQRHEEGEENDAVGSERGEEHKLTPDADQKLEITIVRLKEEEEESDGDAGCLSSPSDGGNEEFIIVKLSDIRREVQCPICLGIIRKTRTVMECLHRFCRECIDKSMRLGNNECPACRTHCASRRSLRDDPNYDALIAALYPDIDRYEEEELAFHEEEKNRNKKIQASIAETFRRQTEALGKRRSAAKATAAAFVRRSQANNRNSGGYLHGRGRNGARGIALVGSEDEYEDNVNGQDSSSAEERSEELRPKRSKRCVVPRASPTRALANADAGSGDNDDLDSIRENLGTSPLQVGSREIPAWGKGGTRSQTRHGNPSGTNGRFIKGMRVAKMVEFLRNLDEDDKKLDVHVTLVPLDEEATPRLERPFLCCHPASSVKHISQYISLQTLVKDENIEVFTRKPSSSDPGSKTPTPDNKTLSNPPEFVILGGQESLAGLYSSTSSCQGDLVLAYRVKMQS